MLISHCQDLLESGVHAAPHFMVAMKVTVLEALLLRQCGLYVELLSGVGPGP